MNFVDLVVTSHLTKPWKKPLGEFLRAPELQAEMDKVTWCDALVFQFPLWWLGRPAILKGWVDRVFAVTFALGSWLAGLGGALAIEIVGLDHAFAFTYLIYVLIVVSVGGLGSIGGSFLAASLLGISDMAGKYYFPELGAFLIYFVMVALLMWRPLGLFGKR